MKVRIFYDPKRKELDYIIRPEPGPIPPTMNPPRPSEPKDTEPPAPLDADKEKPN